MGMFDNIRCLLPLPLPGANDLLYQTKDTPAQFLDTYEIRADGTLWHEDYDTENHSDAAKWKREHPGQEAPKELDRFCGIMTRVRKRWEQVSFTGEITFYEMYGIRDGKLVSDSHAGGWLEWSAYFIDGKIQNPPHILEDRKPDNTTTP